MKPISFLAHLWVFENTLFAVELRQGPRIVDRFFAGYFYGRYQVGPEPHLVRMTSEGALEKHLRSGAITFRATSGHARSSTPTGHRPGGRK